MHFNQFFCYRQAQSETLLLVRKAFGAPGGAVEYTLYLVAVENRTVVLNLSDNLVAGICL